MPLGEHFKLSLKDILFRDCDFEMMSKVLYENAVGNLMYLIVCMRPNIAYAILRYLQGTANVGLTYGMDGGNHVDVTGFVDSVYAKDPDKEVLEAKTVEVLKVGTKHNVEDALTKVGGGEKQEKPFESLPPFESSNDQ
nr:retrovirus-related Pol polyprotein from transposon TNT 1-94 [Tanacetum cinerariifolium]